MENLQDRFEPEKGLSVLHSLFAMLSEHSIRAIDEAIQRLYVHADLSEFPIRLLESVGSLIAGEVTCFTEIIPDEQSVRNVADRPDDRLEALLPVLAEFQLQHPHIVDYMENGQPGALTTGDYLSRKEWHRLDLFQHFYGALGLEDHLVTLMPVAGGADISIVYNRTNRSFTSEEKERLERIRPHIVLAYANAHAVTGIKTSRDDEALIDGPRHGVVRLREDGSLLLCTRRAREVFDRHWKPTSRRYGWSLPNAVEAWVQEQVRADRQRGGASSARRAIELDNRGATVTLRLLNDPRASGWTMLVEEKPWGLQRLAGSPLPPRLQRVLEQLLTGRSEKEIAAALALSPHTVHEYAKQIYRHFGASSRPELMARFIVDPGD